ncbi:histidine phosphatase family protein [Marinobacterium lacunae]|nr:histidine phosphatase family protein [Marinobacterium lacunae]
MSDSDLTLLRRPFVFMRHGETPMNAQGLICGATDVPLSTLGEAQAKSAEWLQRKQWSLVACSGLRRAQHTAQLALPNQSAQPFNGLNERDWGALELRPLDEQTPYEVTPPEGESWPAFCRRVLEAMNRLLAGHELPLIVAHSGVYRVIRALQTGTPHGPRIANAQPVLIEPIADGWTMKEIKENWIEQR